MDTVLSDREEIVRALALLVAPGSVVEMRILNSHRGTVSGYYDDMERLAADAVRWSGRVPAVYITLNPVLPDLLARAANRAREHARATTSDADILRRRWLGIDFDPVRPTGISSTDGEHMIALARARDCLAWLDAEGWSEVYIADSGNGGHLLARVELENDDMGRALIEGTLKALARRFNDAAVHVDETCFNAARIWKLYGTLAAKGDSTAARPHRLARMLET